MIDWFTFSPTVGTIEKEKRMHWMWMDAQEKEGRLNRLPFPKESEREESHWYRIGAGAALRVSLSGRDSTLQHICVRARVLIYSLSIVGYSGPGA